MKLITAGRIYGAIGCIALLCYFVAPPLVELSDRICRPPLACPVTIEAGVREVFALAAIYCLVAGFIISRVLDREPITRGVEAAITFFVALALLAAPLWIVLHAAFW